ncbi:hypothetical protein [Salirhabdus sp. Marseille-P4669]|uniref:hypothetical protein n=1 Tax=Salirhabdus sp. Marseille-P4669 TaxID=2042310 RepID=UPI000C7DB918|nr:hypothetical protein [Salirhabdus sp. Marseille-P4669]
MHYIFSFILSVVLTSLSYFFGSTLLKSYLALWQASLIGISVVSIGAITEALGAPIWLIVLMPFPVGMLLLYLFLKKPFSKWLITYVTVLALYTVIHVVMSFCFQFHSLIPAWKLS